MSKLASGIEHPLAMIGMGRGPTSRTERRLAGESLHGVFSQLLQLFSRVEFREQSRRIARNATLGVHLLGPVVAMLFCRLGRPVPPGDLRRPRLLRREAQPPGDHGSPRATLAYADAHRPWTLYQAVF